MGKRKYSLCAATILPDEKGRLENVKDAVSMVIEDGNISIDNRSKAKSREDEQVL